MSKTLVIAEKPSVAADLARALGGFEKNDDVFEREDMLISSAVGHLLEIVAPEQYDVKRGKWSFAHLPVIPPSFDLQPLPKSEQRLRTLTRLIKRKDVDQLINACDAGREGELIFRYIVQHAKAKQPISRLWLQSMTPTAIRTAFDSLRQDQDLMPLADAARCRSEADWLVGINGTRAMTAFNSKEGGFFLTTVGRVQTPTLAVVVEREELIRQFRAKSYWEVEAEFKVAAGQYSGKWVDPQFKKSETDPDARADRLWDAAAAAAIASACQDKVGSVTEESRPTTQAAPALFDLTSLQREANSRFGFSAKNTLGLAQALYEKHKVLTYPRTDSKALPEDYLGVVEQTLIALSGYGPTATAAKTILAKKWLKPNKRIFDNSKVSDHFAIVPTGQLPRSLSELEQKLFELVSRRFLAIFFPSAEYLNTTRLTTVSGECFRTDGKVLVSPGWLTVYGKEAEEGDDRLVAIDPKDKPLAQTVTVKNLQTKPPARFSEATLLSSMEGAGKLVDDDDLREALAGKGLGTPATRAATIEGLLFEKYLLREARELIPTAKAFQLMTLLRGLDIQVLSRPELTGEWEFKLRQIEEGRLSRESFMQGIATLTGHMVEQARNFSSTTIPGDYATLKTACPQCGGVVKENYRRFACVTCEFSFTKIPGGRTFEVHEAEQLIQDKQLGPVDGFRSKLGRPFAASLKLTTEHKLEFDFGPSLDDDLAQIIDFSDQESLGPCPKCAQAVFAYGNSYVCSKATGPEKSCDFKSGVMILQQTILAEQMVKLLRDGRTDLLDGFVSSRTKRRFKAFLVKTPEGKVGFEFEARAPKKGATKSATEVATKGAKKTVEKEPASPRKKAVAKVAVKKATPAT